MLSILLQPGVVVYNPPSKATGLQRHHLPIGRDNDDDRHTVILYEHVIHNLLGKLILNFSGACMGCREVDKSM